MKVFCAARIGIPAVAVVVWGALLAAAPVAVQAVSIVNSTDGTTLFSADFENGTPGADISNGSPAVGSWTIAAGAVPGRQTVENFVDRSGVALPDLVAYEGSNFARLNKDYSGSPVPLYLIANPDGTALATSGGDLIRLELAFQVPSFTPHGNNNAFGILFTDSALPAHGGDRGIGSFMEFQFLGDGTGGATDINTFFTPFDWNFAPNNWNTLRIDYVNGSGSFDISFNGNPVQTIDNQGVPDGLITDIRFSNLNTSGGDLAYIDAIAAPIDVSFNTITVTNAAAMEFGSQVGVDYRLQVTTDLVTPTNWVDTGASIAGDGGTLLLFDPTGSSTQKSYRILGM